MTESSSYRYQEESQSRPPPGAPIQPAQYKFSPEELKVLGECNRESFFQRSMPLGTVLGLGTFAAVQSGKLKSSPRFGAMPKVTLAVIAGYFLGKLSYQQACAEKLMALPGSYIGQLLRDRRDGKVSAEPKQAATMFGAGPGDIYSDAGPGSSLDLDTDRPIFSDDSYRPDTDLPGPAGPARPVLSYEELRRQNRGQHAESRQDPYRLDPDVVPAVSRAPPPAAPPRAPPRPAHTNKYGDVVD